VDALEVVPRGDAKAFDGARDGAALDVPRRPEVLLALGR
jgi:hypothetical protein